MKQATRQNNRSQRKTARAYALVLLALVLVCLTGVAKAQGPAFEWTGLPDPANGAIAPGEMIAFTLTVTEEGALDEWVTLTVTLGAGMQYDRYSVSITGGDSDQAVERELVPGNNGFILLAAKLIPGDTVSFVAWAESNSADISATAQANKKSDNALLPVATLRYELEPLPEPTPLPEAAEPVAPTPVPAVGQEETTTPTGAGKNLQWILLAVLACVLVIVVYCIVRMLRSRKRARRAGKLRTPKQQTARKQNRKQVREAAQRFVSQQAVAMPPVQEITGGTQQEAAPVVQPPYSQPPHYPQYPKQAAPYYPQQPQYPEQTAPYYPQQPQYPEQAAQPYPQQPQYPEQAAQPYPQQPSYPAPYPQEGVYWQTDRQAPPAQPYPWGEPQQND